MAKRVIQELIDDLDGKPADESVTFGLDGVQYSIDLSKKNAEKLRGALKPYISAGTKVGRSAVVGARTAAGRARGTTRGDRDQNRAIREWAQGAGFQVSDRGRIKQEIVDQYHANAGR
ncbi:MULTISPECIES: histone-like nucleoid-structuring protein Lsr2 [Dactylosporangium]|uniref:Lsr2 family protein n=2 Tax=Dactylosporangium TaxID=35753 RepID=A0A9W6KT61_9ACTN|nr:MULTISPECIES: Lsr2 family protein [Dactylosporangium]UAB93290.1 Lsr2 family protein [Dactylosporangium vinaceum]UWZ41673.1 Lsr2 family protein [Dactylosporangium matsuzakiense]GLL06720.1 Lsr2 family protein [Dactylosporangium matsuzakiense]